MPLSPQEEAELAQLEAFDRGSKPAAARGRLTPAEQAELDELEAMDAPAAPRGAVADFGVTAAKYLPFSETVQQVASGKGYGGDKDMAGKVAQGFGDVATAAGLGAGAIATGGIAPVMRATGLGAGIMAGLEKSGVTPAFMGAAQEAAESDTIPTFIPGMSRIPKAGGRALGMLPESLRQPAAFLQEIPGALESTALEFAPAAAATVLGGAAPKAAGAGLRKAGMPRAAAAAEGLGADFAGVARDKRAAAAERAASPERLLEQYGGVRTPAMTDRKGPGGAMARRLDEAMEVDPISSYLPENARKRNTAAIEKYVEEKVGQGAGGANPRDWGQTVEGLFDEAASQAKSSFGGVKKELAALPWSGKGTPGAAAAKALESILESEGQPKGKGGFTFNENATEMPKEIFDAFEGLRRELASKPPKSVGELNNKLTQFKNRNRALIQGMMDPGQRGTAEHFFGQGFGALEDVRGQVIEQASKAAGKPDLPGRLADVSGEYRDFAQGLKKSLSKFGDPNFNPEQYVDFVRSKLTGLDSVKRLERVLGPEGFKAFQDVNLKALFESAKNYQRGNIMSLDKLRSLWNDPKKFGNIKELFRPDQRAAVENTIKMSEKSKVSDLFDINRSGSGTVITRNLLPVAMAQLAGMAGGGVKGLAAVGAYEAMQHGRFLSPRIADAAAAGARRFRVPERTGYLQPDAFPGGGGGVPVQTVSTAVPLAAQTQAQEPRLYDLYRR